MRAALIGIALAIGCRSPETRGRRTNTPPPVAPQGSAAERGAAQVTAPIARELAPVPAVIAPHGTAVIRVAITDGGDAALSLDAGGEVRLWPALDGTREPIVVRASAARELALARVGGELVAAIVDAAGGGELQRFDASGALVGRVALPVEPPIQQLEIAGDLVLARRGDQTLAGYGVRGDVRGRLDAPPQRRLVSIVARGVTAFAAISGESGAAARTLRRIAPGPRLAWGEPIELLEELSALALSPSGRAIAGLAYDQIGRIVELEPRQRIVAIIAPSATVSPQDLPGIGFLDEGTALLTSRTLHMRARRTGATWTVDAPPLPRPFAATATPVVFGDGAAIAGLHTGLGILAPSEKFLGYRDSTAIEIRDRPLVVRTQRNRLVWLDDRLREVRVSDPAEAPSMSELGRARVLDGDRLALVQRPPPGVPPARDPPLWRVAFRDLARGTEQELATGERLAQLEFDRGTGVLAAYSDRRVLRYRMSPGGPTQLAGIPALPEIQHVYLTDPAMAGGVVAVASVSGATAHAYVESAGAALKLQSKTQTRGWIFQVDRAGRIYAAEGGKLAIYRDGKLLKQLSFRNLRRVAVTEDATAFAVLQDNDVVAYDASGTERWRMTVPNTIDLAWSGGRLLVSSHAGLQAFDGGTRSLVARACAWSFGLHDPAHAAPVFAGLALHSACAAD